MTIINPNSISGISSITALNSTAAINLFKADGTSANIIAGVVTAASLDISGDIDFDGHTNLDNVSIAGVTTITSAAPELHFTDTNADSDYSIVVNTGQFRIRDETNSANRLAVNSDGHVDIYGRLDAIGGFLASSDATIEGDLTLTSTDAGSSAAPEFKLYRNSASPADADYLGQIKFAGESDTGVERNYAKITGKILDASNGTEDGILEFAHIKAGSQTITGRWRSDSLQLLNGTNFSVAGTSEFTGVINANNGINLTDSDNKSILLGASDDMRIRHTGSHSEITDEGTGDLRLGSNRTVIGNATFSETQARFIQNGAVELYYNNIKNCETNSAGISLFGQEGGDCVLDMNADEGDDYPDKWRLNVTQGGSFQLKNFADGSWENHIQTTVNSSVELYHNGTKKFETTTNGSKLSGAQQDLHGDVKFDNQTNSGMDLRWDESLNRLHFEQDNIKAVFGTSSDFEIYHDPNYNILKGINAQATQFWTNNSPRWRIQASGHIMPEANNAYDIGTSSYKVKDIYANGNLNINGNIVMASAASGRGIDFSASANASNASASMSSELFDDYEEGTFTPTDVSGHGITITNNNPAQYTKIGRFVHVTFDCTWAGGHSGGGNAQISLPFAMGEEYGSGSVGWNQVNKPLQVHVNSAGAAIMENYSNGSGGRHLSNNSASGNRIIGDCSYFTGT